MPNKSVERPIIDEKNLQNLRERSMNLKLEQKSLQAMRSTKHARICSDVPAVSGNKVFQENAVTRRQWVAFIAIAGTALWST